MMLNVNALGLAAEVQAGVVGTVAAPHRLTLEASRTGSRQMYTAWFRGEELLTSADPEHAAARELLARGFTGCLETWWLDGTTPAMRMDIEAAADRKTSEGVRTGPVTGKYVPFDNAAATFRLDADCRPPVSSLAAI